MTVYKERMISKGTLRQFYAALSCQLSALMVGTGFVWLTPLMVKITGPNSEIPMTNDDVSWLIAIIQIGFLIGPIPAGMLANRIGRKTALLTTGPAMLLGWVLTLWSRNLSVLYIVKIIQGLCMGMVMTVAPIYVAEVVGARNRGQAAAHICTMWFLGLLLAYSTGPYLSYNVYSAVCSIPAFIFLGCFIIAPESPYYLLLKGKVRKAHKALVWLRGTEDIEEELKSISQCVEDDLNHAKGGVKQLISVRSTRISLFVLLVIQFIKFFGGEIAVVNYATKTFTDSASNLLEPDVITIIIGIVFLLSNFIAAYLTDAVGRKKLVLWSSFGVGTFSAIIGVYYYLERHTSVSVMGYEWIVYIAFAGYCIFINAGVGPVTPALQAELFPSHSRATAGSIVTSVGTLFIFISLKFYQLIDDHVGVYFNYVIFSASAFIGLIILAIVMTEPARKTLGEIQTSHREKDNKNKETIVTKC